MTFTSLPEMFSSVFGPLAYTFSNAAETELFLEILSTRDGFTESCAATKVRTSE